jgi:drug/metabolite transporter (DMT)-like permease
VPLSQGDGSAARSSSVAPSRAALVAAFLVLYLVWGSTYLAIRFAVAEVPPFVLSGLRFIAAGGTLLLWRRWRGGVALPTARQWLGAAAVGTLMVVLSNAAVVAAEESLASGVVALFAAGTPLLIALFDRRRTGARLGRGRMLGVLLGTAGLAILADSAFVAVHDVRPILLLVVSEIAWAVGSTWGRDWPAPTDHLMASAAQMLAGGVIALAAGIVTGDLAVLHGQSISLGVVLAWSYLAIAGSLLAYPVFQWLLSVADPTAVVSYTYVNPIVALVLGVIFGHEQLTVRTILATVVLIPAVVLVVSGTAATKTGQDRAG